MTTPPPEVIRKVGEMGHSRVPVYSGDLDHIVGVLYFKDLLRAMSEGGGVESAESAASTALCAGNSPD